MTEPATYCDFMKHPNEQWREWIGIYLQTTSLQPAELSDLLAASSSKIIKRDIVGFQQVVDEALTTISTYPNAFEEFVLPELHNHNWDRLNELATRAGDLPLSVQEALISPLFTHPQCAPWFADISEKLRNGHFGAAHPFLNPLVLRTNPLLIQRYRLFPSVFRNALNTNYFERYGADGLAALFETGLITQNKQDIVLDYALASDTPELLLAVAQHIAIDFSQVRERGPHYFSNAVKRLAFFDAFVSLTDDNTTLCWMFCETLNEDFMPLQTQNAQFVRRLAAKIEWNEETLYKVMASCPHRRTLGDHLLKIRDALPVERLDVLDPYFETGGFEMTEELSAYAQQRRIAKELTTSSSVAPQRRL